MGRSGPEREHKRADVLDALRDTFDDDQWEPFTSKEIAEEMGCSRRIAYGRLRELHELGDVETKKVGARGRVWWLTRGDDR